MSIMKIDLNCDLGELAGNDEAIMPYITSANIACGFHAGDANVMYTTVKLAKRHNVAVGAHPSWPDLQGFGRREMNMSMEETEALVLYQIGALAGIAKAEDVELVHVKPHGALYNQAARDKPLAQAIAHAVKAFNRDLILVGLAGSALCEAGHAAGLTVAAEGFPDRAYNPDGTLMPRNIKGAVIESHEAVASNAVKLIREGILFSGERAQVDTLCLHGDNVHAPQNAKTLRDVLIKNNIQIKGLK